MSKMGPPKPKPSWAPPSSDEKLTIGPGSSPVTLQEVVSAIEDQEHVVGAAIRMLEKMYGIEVEDVHLLRAQSVEGASVLNAVKLNVRLRSSR